MQHVWKRIVLTLTAAALLVGLLGCGKQQSGAQNQDKPNEQSGNNQSQSADTENNKPNEEIQFLYDELGDGKCALRNCLGDAKTITVPGELNGLTVVQIKGNCFIRGMVEEIILPDSVEYIAGFAFNGCEQLRTVKFGAGLKKIGQMAFNICPKLESLSFPEGMESMSLPFISCTELKEVYIPATVTEIDERIAFPENCPNLIVITPSGSAAEQSAIESGIPVKNP